jgi:hypothetical protein
MTYLKSYFIRYAIFLALFPFSFLIGSVSNFKAPYDSAAPVLQGQGLGRAYQPMPLRVYDLPKRLAKITIEFFKSKVSSKVRGFSDKKTTSNSQKKV